MYILSCRSLASSRDTSPPTCISSCCMEQKGALQDDFAAGPENHWKMMWHIGMAVITAAVILTMMLGLVVLKGAKSLWRGKGGSGVPLHVWMALLLPNTVMHACGGAMRKDEKC